MGDVFRQAQNAQGSDSIDVLTQIAQQLFEETSPIREDLIGRSAGFLEGDLDVTQSPMFAPLKGAIESQFGRARENIIANTPRGGTLTDALADLEGTRAQALASGIGGLAQDELARAFGLATGGAEIATSGLSSAGNIQAQLAMANAQRRAGRAQALGFGIGSIIGGK